MIYLIYDTALNGPYTFVLLQQQYTVSQSLFMGTKDEALSDVAPYLFVIDELLYEKISGPLTSLKAIVIFRSDESIQNLGLHFKQFIYEKINGKENYFRFWDARVLKIFLPSCSPQKLEEFFEGIQLISLPDEMAGTAANFSIHRGKLQNKQIDLQEIFGAANPGNQHKAEQQLNVVSEAEANDETRKPRKFFTD